MSAVFNTRRGTGARFGRDPFSFSMIARACHARHDDRRSHSSTDNTTEIHVKCDVPRPGCAVVQCGDAPSWATPRLSTPLELGCGACSCTSAAAAADPYSDSQNCPTSRGWARTRLIVSLACTSESTVRARVEDARTRSTPGWQSPHTRTSRRLEWIG